MSRLAKQNQMLCSVEELVYVFHSVQYYFV